MSTVTLSKPHCAITSAENPEGIASQAFTTALPEAHTFLTLLAIGRVSFCFQIVRGLMVRRRSLRRLEPWSSLPILRDAAKTPLLRTRSTEWPFECSLH